ncbi:MAG: glycogen debranching enzyme family protein [Acidobacteria bacterium]|nr:glycogen debranching enzyme family protein [Acidobacteriota bacterium]
MISFGSEICQDFEKASSREWLETNGIGGFASSTISGANTRRYHGLLIVEDQRYEISANQYPGRIYPEGFVYLKSFRVDPFPIWTFEVGGHTFEKKVFMIHGQNTVVCCWSLKHKNREATPQVGLELKPLLAFRDYHHLQRENSEFNEEFEGCRELISVQPYAEIPALFFANNALSLEGTGHWYRNVQYAIEQERGFDFTEDLFQPFSLGFDLSEDAIVVASLGPRNSADAADYETSEINRRKALVETAGAQDDFSEQLVLAADQFIVSRGEGSTVIAGYHWFSDWGRDTMIALNGLTLATNRAHIAKNILKEFSNHLFEGLLPNRFPDLGDEPKYNTVDATLWYFDAARSYAATTGDYDFIRIDLYEKLVEVIDWHFTGTRYQIHVDSDGLLYASEDGVQLTWRDAKIGAWVVTPRTGKTVEIQALWYNALCIMADFADRFDDKKNAKRFRAAAAKAKRSFDELFWNEAEQCLFDVVDVKEKDASLRPNQIFAASLPYTMLNKSKARKVVETVEAELLTPCGPRSLSPRDSRYVSEYIGSPFNRDSSYHQGTVWPWLIGAFIDAYRRINPRNDKTDEHVGQIISSFRTHLSEGGVGQVAEIFDADFPHAPRGCMAQAWSVAELLRVCSPAVG